MTAPKAHGGARPRAGRPPVPAEERRSVRVTCWLTPAEAAAIEAVRGESEAAVWIREAAVDRAQRRAARRA